MRKLFISAILLIWTFSSYSQYVKFWILEPKVNLFSLVNFYTVPHDFSEYRVSVDGYPDTPLKKLNLVIGSSWVVKGRETIAFNGLPMGGTKGAMSLYLPGDTVNHIRGKLYDYVQWGSDGHHNEDSADILGLWKKGTFIGGTSPFIFKCDEWNFGVNCWQSGKPPIIIMRFAYISPINDVICIKNAGVSNIDLSYGTICINGTCYDSLKNAPVQIIKGNLDLAKNDSIWLRVAGNPLDTSSGSLAFFALPGQTADTTLLLDFIQWGKPNLALSGLAHLKGIWDSTTFISIANKGDSLRYTGDFTRNQTGVTYWISCSPSNIGIYNAPVSKPVFYPNPANQNICFEGVPDIHYSVYTTEGRILQQGNSNGCIQFNQFKPGFYYIQFEINNITYTQPLVIDNSQ